MDYEKTVNNFKSMTAKKSFEGKRIIILFSLCFLCTFFALSDTAFASGFYTPVEAQIPFYTEKVSNNGSVTYNVRIEGTKGSEPMPAATEITVKAGESGHFDINITEPGTYIYKVYQKKGSSGNVQYDDRVYDVHLCVVNGNNNSLSCTVAVMLANSSTKPDKLDFTNKSTGSNPPPSIDPNPPKPGPPVKGGGASSKTGENTGTLIAIYCGIMGLLIAGAVVYIVLKNRTKKIAEEPLNEAVTEEFAGENEDNTQ